MRHQQIYIFSLRDYVDVIFKFAHECAQHIKVKIQFDKFVDIRTSGITLSLPADSQF